MSIATLKKKTMTKRNFSHNNNFSLGNRNTQKCSSVCNTVKPMDSYRKSQGFHIKKITKECLKIENEDNTAKCTNNCPSKSAIRYPVLMWKRDVGAVSYDTYLKRIVCYDK